MLLSAQAAAQPQLDDLAYTYDPSGNLTRSKEIIGGGTGAPVRTQCYDYDGLDQLAQAWTATENCAGDPSTATGATTVGGTTPYWTSWDTNSAGLRTTQTQHSVTSGSSATTATSYAYGVSGHADALASTTTGATGTSYSYDANGNTTGRSIAGGSQTLKWDAENHLSSVTAGSAVTGYVYDADGNVLLRHDPTSTTLYLPGEELTRTTATGTVVGTRYYSQGGVPVALRVGGANPVYLDTDPHGTNQIVVNSTSYAVTRRTFDPYGNPLGSVTGGAWPDAHGFLGKPVSTNTGLTDIGAREYDAGTGRFLSVDPVLDTNNPESLNGYTYASNNPVGNSDPTGLMQETESGGRDCSIPRQCIDAAINDSYGDGMAAGLQMPSYDNFVSWANTGTPTGNFKDFLGGILHTVASVDDSVSATCQVTGQQCYGAAVSNAYNKHENVDTTSLAYGAAEVLTTTATLITPEAAFDGIDAAVTAGRAIRAARAVEVDPAAVAQPAARLAQDMKVNRLFPDEGVDPGVAVSE